MHLAVNKVWYITCQAVMSTVKKSEAREGCEEWWSQGGKSHFIYRHLEGLPKVMAEQKPGERKP